MSVNWTDSVGGKWSVQHGRLVYYSESHKQWRDWVYLDAGVRACKEIISAQAERIERLEREVARLERVEHDQDRRYDNLLGTL